MSTEGERFQVFLNPKKKIKNFRGKKPAMIPIPGYDKKKSFNAWLARARLILLSELPVRMARYVAISINRSVITDGDLRNTIKGLVIAPGVDKIRLSVRAPAQLDPDEEFAVTTDMIEPTGSVAGGLKLTTLPAGEELEFEAEVEVCRARAHHRALCSPVTNVRFSQVAENEDYVFEYEVKPNAGSGVELFYEMLEFVDQYPPGVPLPEDESDDDLGMVAAASSELSDLFL